MSKICWPSWFYGPNNQSAIFESESLVPKGWQDHPSKVSEEKPKPVAAAAINPAPVASDGATPDVDADGWPYDPALHAATKTKTQAGLWRMKVGVSRPVAKTLDL